MLHLKESKLLGSAIVALLKNKYPLQVNDYLQQRNAGPHQPKFPATINMFPHHSNWFWLYNETRSKPIEKYAGQNLLNSSTTIPANQDTTSQLRSTCNSVSADINKKIKDITNVLKTQLIPQQTPLYIVDLKKLRRWTYDTLTQHWIDDCVWKDAPAIKNMRQRARNGLIEIANKSSQITGYH